MLAVAMNTHQIPPSRSSELSLAASPLRPPAGMCHLPTCLGSWNCAHRPVCSKRRRSSPLQSQRRGDVGPPAGKPRTWTEDSHQQERT